MNWVLHEIKEKSLLSPSQEPYFLFHSPPPPFPSSEPSSFNLNNRVSPSILLIIIILAIIFFISGLLHLLVRLLFSPPNREPDEYENSTVLHGQLQQLFNLHDAGVDQSFIDNLPVFNYKEIIGLKDPFDCAVCLCEFEGEDKLRLLPKCSHAFHMDCIDTWLLSHSTCPLCRACLLYDFSVNSNFSPFVLVLESGSQSVQEIVSEREVARVNSHLSVHCDQDFRLAHEDLEHKSDEIQEKGEKVVSVKLGKFKCVDNNGDEGSSSEGNSDARRCFSMGSYAYVMDDNSSLQVPIRTPMKKQSSKKTFLPLQPDHKRAISECGCDSRREFNGIDAFKFLDIQGDSKSIGRSKIGSFSLSKIWSRAKNDEANESSKRAVSFRFGSNRNMTASDESKNKNGGVGSTRTISEINISRWENGGSEIGFDDEIQSIDSQENPPTFAKRTLGWFIGRQNKVVHSSFSSNNV